MPPAAAIRAVVDSAFNAMLLEAFLCGLYTLLFAYTLRTLLRQENRKAYAAVLTLLWVLVMLAFAFDWQYHRTAFVIDNDSPLDTALAILNDGGGESLVILDNMFSMFCILLADALLVWRCYILWEDKRWISVPLPILLTAAIVLGTLSNIPQFTPANAVDNVILLVSFFCVSIAITFVGTSLIILRILLVTRSSPLTTHTSTYRNIQRILVESGILYTIAMFITGVALGNPVSLHKQPSIPFGDLGIYSQSFLVPLSGIGPTLIAARVGKETPLKSNAAASRTRSHSRVLSHLVFRRTVRQSTAFEMENGLVVSSRGDSAIASSIGKEDHEGHAERMAVHSSDTTL